MPVYAEYIMRNTGLEEAQAGIKTAQRNINNLRYADDATLMAERYINGIIIFFYYKTPDLMGLCFINHI